MSSKNKLQRKSNVNLFFNQQINIFPEDFFSTYDKKSNFNIEKSRNIPHPKIILPKFKENPKTNSFINTRNINKNNEEITKTNFTNVIKLDNINNLDFSFQAPSTPDKNIKSNKNNKNHSMSAMTKNNSFQPLFRSPFNNILKKYERVNRSSQNSNKNNNKTNDKTNKITKSYKHKYKNIKCNELFKETKLKFLKNKNINNLSTYNQKGNKDTNKEKNKGNEKENEKEKDNTKRKEEGFNNNHFQMKYGGNSYKYYPLMDKFLTSYLQSGVNINILKNRNLINEKKKILYDPEYKELYKFINPPIDLNENKLATFIMKANLSKNLNIKEKDYKKEFLSKKPEMKYHLPGINGIPEYYMYLNKSERKKMKQKKLPPLKKRKEKNDEENKDEEKNKAKKKEKEIEDILLINMRLAKDEEKKEMLERGANNENKEKNEENKDEEKINTDKYKEIKFQPTPVEANSM